MTGVILMNEIKISKVYNENCLETMAKMPDNFVDLTVTSPPYDNLRTYKGYEFDFESIAKELYRVTKQGGVVVWVVGDATINGSETGTSFRQALYFKDVCGFNLHDTMIYNKINPIPQNHNRYEQCFEFMFILSKNKIKTFNPIMLETKNAGKIFNWGDRKIEFDKNQCRRHRKTEEITCKNEKIKNNIFSYSIGNGKEKHPAVFPEQLAKDHIISRSNEGDLVYDPFMGSGTTAKMAIINNRNYIGSEICKEYCDIANKRIQDTQNLMMEK